ncbi:SCP domain-containing protein [Meloidogyne graminicola]|uniref:SCP domain-containing protein n=1 Tax=Meloidogyne graminicola TaxID=189291 RepID=A0A8S9ZF62_9BILA|nr:SCP domain-containing protein [Meloidogyne graminicola]
MFYYIIFSLTVFYIQINYILSDDINCILTDEHRLAVLHAHNKYREKLACGEVTDSSNKTLPGGILYRFIYNKTMEKLSQETANKCQMKHSNDTLYGENLYASSYSMNITDALIAAVDMWWAEKDACPIAANNLNATDAVWQGCGHWIPMAQSQSIQISCGVSNTCGSQDWCATAYNCKQTTLVSCNYFNPSYNGDNQIYTAGNKCTKNEDCSVYKNSVCEPSGLCRSPNKWQLQ